MLTVNMARDYIFRVPKCQMEALSHASWTCGDPDGSHQHTVFGNHIVRDNKLVPKTENDCQTSLLTVLLQEDNCKEAIKDEEWSCFDPKQETCSLHYGDDCRMCGMEKPVATWLLWKDG